MSITADQPVDPTDFINQSEADATPSNDAGRVPKLESTGRIHPQFLSPAFGGDGSDGALTATSGNTNIDLAGAREIVLNYSSISITGTGSVTFINPHDEGSFVTIKCAGDFTITSSVAPALSVVACGALGGNKAVTSFTSGTNGDDAFGSLLTTNFGLAGSHSGSGTRSGGAVPTDSAYNATIAALFLGQNKPLCAPGAGGGGGAFPDGSGDTPGDGGRGGGVLFIEVAGVVNFTTANGISAAGEDGEDAATNGGSCAVGGGGAGGGGCVYFFYKIVSAFTGTITAAGGIGGTKVDTYGGYGATYSGAGGGSTINPGGNATTNSNGGTGAEGLTHIENV